MPIPQKRTVHWSINLFFLLPKVIILLFWSFCFLPRVCFCVRQNGLVVLVNPVRRCSYSHVSCRSGRSRPENAYVLPTPCENMEKNYDKIKEMYERRCCWPSWYDLVHGWQVWRKRRTCHPKAVVSKVEWCELPSRRKLQVIQWQGGYSADRACKEKYVEHCSCVVRQG